MYHKCCKHLRNQFKTGKKLIFSKFDLTILLGYLIKSKFSLGRNFEIYGVNAGVSGCNVL